MNACVIRITSSSSSDEESSCNKTKTKILLVKHKERQWEFPGGKIDYNKDRYADTQIVDLMHTAQRELQEETSIPYSKLLTTSPTNILFNAEYNTVFFVYRQHSVTDDDDVTGYTITDLMIEQVIDVDVDNIDKYTFSFETDKTLIKQLLL